MARYRKRLTEKQQKLIKAQAENPNATLAELAQLANYNDKAAVSKAFDSPAVRERVADLMEKSNKLNRKALLGSLEEGLGAWRRDPAGPENIPDFKTRHSYLETAFKLNRDLIPEENTIPHTQIMVGIINAIDSAKRDGVLE